MAKTYQDILLAVDFHEDNAAVIERATSMAELHGARLMLVHVLEPIRMVYPTDGFNWGAHVENLEEEYRQEREKKLKILASELGIDEPDTFLLSGRPGSEIHDLCQDISVDLIILGTHGQHGIQLLLGSTANSVLHGSTCDVLAVRIKS